MVQEKLQTTVEIDGMIFDTETGECLGATKPEFHVTDEKSAEWVMSKVFALDAEILAYESRLKALSENLGTMKAEKERQRAGLLYRFGPELEHFAKENLPKGKKTWTCPYGSVSFRTTHPRLDVVDEALAVAFCKTYAPEAVKVKESVLKSLIPDRVQAELAAAQNETGQTFGFELVAGGESTTIKTGV